MLALLPKDVDREGAGRFVDALGETTPAAWLAAADIARQAARMRERLLDVITTCAEKLGVYDDLWQIADGIETAAWYVLPDAFRAPRTPDDAATRKHAMDAARLAAYGILLRAHLAAADFDQVIAPFRALVDRAVGG